MTETTGDDEALCWRALVENSPDIILVVDMEGTALFINRARAPFQNQAVVGAKIWQFTKDAGEERIRGVLRRVAETRLALRYEAPGFAADGGVAWFEVSVVPLVVRGNVDRVLWTATDITERKHAAEEGHRSQQLLRLVLDTLPVGVTVQDCDANIVMFNPASRRIWGDIIESALQRYDRSIGFWHASGARLATEEWGSQRAIFHGETSLNELIDIESLDGRKRTMRNSAAPIRDDQQRIIGAVVVNEDVAGKR